MLNSPLNNWLHISGPYNSSHPKALSSAPKVVRASSMLAYQLLHSVIMIFSLKPQNVFSFQKRNQLATAQFCVPALCLCQPDVIFSSARRQLDYAACTIFLSVLLINQQFVSSVLPLCPSSRPRRSSAEADKQAESARILQM